MKTYTINGKKAKFNTVLKIKDMKVFSELSAKLGENEGKTEVEMMGNIEVIVDLLTLFCINIGDLKEKDKINEFLGNLELKDIEQLTKIFTEIMEEISKKK